jgi:hypothetical protein
VALSSGCTPDPLYTYCVNDDQCSGDDDFYCVEVGVQVSPDRETDGRFCTMPCRHDGDCIGIGGVLAGHCIQWVGDDEAFCYLGCVTDSDCYPSSTCEEVVVSDRPKTVCLPDRL